MRTTSECMQKCYVLLKCVPDSSGFKQEIHLNQDPFDTKNCEQTSLLCHVLAQFGGQLFHLAEPPLLLGKGLYTTGLARGRATDPGNATVISNEATHTKLLLSSTIAAQVTEMNASKIETFVKALLTLASYGLKQMLSLCTGDALNLDDDGEQIHQGE